MIAVIGFPLQIYIIAIDNYTINAQVRMNE
jgi:hypothetical protein